MTNAGFAMQTLIRQVRSGRHRQVVGPFHVIELTCFDVMLGAAMADSLLGVLFVLAFLKTRQAATD